MDVKFYLSRFLRRVHYFLLLAVLGSVVGLTLARLLPPVYIAEALLVVESEQIPGDLAASTVRTQAGEQLQIIQQRILSRGTLLEMANRLQIYATPGDGPAQLRDADDIVEDLRERIQIVVMGGNQPRGAPVQATLVTVSFEAPTPQMSAAVANELVTLILAENVTMRTSVARQTLEFFEREVSELDKQLTELGATILKFKEANQDALPDSLEFRRSQQAANQERLLQLGRAETELTERRARLVRMQESTGGIEPDPANMTPEQRQLKALRDQLSSLLAVLAPGNPKIRMLEAQIASLESVVAAQSGAAGNGPGLSAFEIQLSDIDVQLKFVRDQQAYLGQEMERLSKSIAATPGNTSALDKLERDYANLRQQYDQAVANKAQATTGDVIEALSKGQRISVIEQAVAPREPTRPNRLVIAAAGIFGGIALGFGLVVLMEVMNRAVRRPADLVAGLNITPLAVLPYLRSQREIRRRRLVIGLAFALVVLAVPAGLWFVHSQITPLDLLMDRQIRKFSL